MKTQIFTIAIMLLGGMLFMSMHSNEPNTQEPWPVPAKYEKMKNPFADVKDAKQTGRILYTKHCKSCHGTKGTGDGPKAEDLDTEIGDFTADAFKAQSDGALYYKTYIGRDDMPSFKKKIVEEKAQWMLINYIKGL